MILPSKNQKDLPDIPEEIRNDLEFYFCSRMSEVLNIALGEEALESRRAEWRAEREQAQEIDG